MSEGPRLILPAVRRRIREANRLRAELVLVDDVDTAVWELPDGPIEVGPTHLESARGVASVVVATGPSVEAAWAWGAPVVTDAASLTAAGGTSGVHALTGESPAERLELARTLARHEGRAAELARAGHEMRRTERPEPSSPVSPLASVFAELGAPAGGGVAERLTALAAPVAGERVRVIEPHGASFESLPAPVSSVSLARARFPMAPEEAPTMRAESSGGSSRVRQRLAGLKQRARRRVAAKVRTAVVPPEVAAAPDRIDDVAGELARVAAELDRVRVQIGSTAQLSDANQINLELLKAEVRSSESRLNDLGFAFAPATGLEGAGARFSELREAVNGLERQLRNLATVPTHAPTPGSTDVPVAPKPESTLFNYVGFERRFRGDPEVILATLEERYADLLVAHQPVVDVGCGRGELLDRLAARGADVIGVEPDPGMVADARARGLTVHQAFAGDYLRSVPDHSLGSIISTHVVEHLELDILIEFLELARQKLKPGGIFVAETPNPSSLIVLGNSYILDPTHVWPLHPSLLAFLAETAGYRDVRLAFYSPAEGYHLAPVELAEDATAAEKTIADGVNASFERLNHVLFGPQDYSIVATTPPA